MCDIFEIMATLKDIQNAIKEKQNGLNADIHTFIRIAQEDERMKKEKIINEQIKKLEYDKFMNRMGIKTI